MSTLANRKPSKVLTDLHFIFQLCRSRTSHISQFCRLFYLPIHRSRTWTSGWADFEIPSLCWVCCDSARYDSMQWLACNDLECRIYRDFYGTEERGSAGVGARSSNVFQFANHKSDLQAKCGAFPTNCSRIIRTCQNSDVTTGTMSLPAIV